MAQEATNNIDSLLNLLPAAKPDTAKVQLYIDIGNEYESDNPQVAEHYYALAGILARKLNNKKFIIKYISNYSAMLNQRAAFDSSLLLNKESIKLARSLNDKVMLGKVFANTGNVFQYTNAYDSAVYYYETAKKYFEQANEKIFLARMCDLLSNTYRELNQKEKALALSKESVAVLRTTADSMSLGIAISNLGSNFSKTDDEAALNCFKESIEISRRIHFTRLEMTNRINMGDIYFHRYDAANIKPNYEAALQLSQELGEPESESTALRGLCFYYLLTKDFDAAKTNISKALAISDSLDLQKEHLENLKAYSSVLYALHDVVNAEQMLDSAGRIEDKIAGDDVNKMTLTIEKKFETEKKEAQIKLQQAQLKQKSTLNYFLIGGAAALLVISLLVYRNYRHKQKLQQQRINELETEKHLTATEAVLKGEEQERTRLAKDLHDGLGGMLSGIKYSLSNMKGNLIMTPDNAQAFERSIDMLDSSIKEMRRVAHNMMPEVLVKYGLDTALKEYCNEIDRSGVIHTSYHSMGLNETEIEQTTAVTIYRIVQELVNNSIKHAAATNVLVQTQYSKTEKLLSVTVEDDGKGFDIAILKNANGIGWSNIQNRVDFLKGKIDLQSGEGRGTSVLIEISI